MITLDDKMILSGAGNRPPMLEKDMYDSWKSRMELYMMNRHHGRMIIESVENGPLLWLTIKENGVTRPKKYSELSATEAIQADCDVKATNIILQGLPPEVYALVSNHKVAKELWERIQLFMQGTLLTKQERECKLYDEFDKFAYKKEEIIMHLDTILEKESNEFIKSSVENLVPNTSESEDLSNIRKIISIKIDPHHFNAESDLIESLLNQDSSIISSSKIVSLLDEFAGELIFLKSIPLGIDEADCDPEEEIRLIEKLLYDNSSPRPSKEFNSKNFDAIIESSSPSPIPVEDSDSLMKEIDLSLTPDDSMPPRIENDDYDSEGDILLLE
nr:hypothetical protein [Tanacetum cinerariifolium]